MAPHYRILSSSGFRVVSCSTQQKHIFCGSFGKRLAGTAPFPTRICWCYSPMCNLALLLRRAWPNLVHSDKTGRSSLRTWQAWRMPRHKPHTDQHKWPTWSQASLRLADKQIRIRRDLSRCNRYICFWNEDWRNIQNYENQVVLLKIKNLCT